MKTLLVVRIARGISLGLISLLWLSHVSFSQQPSSAGAPEIREVDGYTIRIVRLADRTFGYEISRGPDLLLRQKRNPFTGSATGLTKKEDAMKTATWLVKTALKKPQMLPRHRILPERLVLDLRLPRTVAAELGISAE